MSDRLFEPAAAVPGARTAWALSLAGALPFVLASLFLLATDRQNVWFGWFVDVVRTYGAVILSFVGGIRWGAALQSRPQAFAARDERAGRTFALSVVPSLAAWIALVMEPVFGFAFLAAAFAAQGAWDGLSGPPTFAAGAVTPGRLPLWFVRLRMTITFIVVACLLVALFAVA